MTDLIVNLAYVLLPPLLLLLAIFGARWMDRNVLDPDTPIQRAQPKKQKTATTLSPAPKPQ